MRKSGDAEASRAGLITLTVRLTREERQTLARLAAEGQRTSAQQVRAWIAESDAQEAGREAVA